MPSKGGGAGGGGKGATGSGSRGMRSMGVLSSPRGRAHPKPVGARESGQVRAYGQQQRYAITAPSHVISHAQLPESPWVQWWRQNPDLLRRTRGLMGTLPPGYGLAGGTRAGAGVGIGAHPGVAPARRRLR